jgi:hypothetical protein
MNHANAPIAGERLLTSLTGAQRADLMQHVEETYAAIDTLNAADRYGKACCWMDMADQPAIGLEEVARSVVQHDMAHAGDECDLDGVVGFEWWLQRRTRQDIPFHHDTNWNDAESGSSSDVRFPVCSSVLYLSDYGGPTVIIEPLERELMPDRVPARPEREYELLINRTVGAAARSNVYFSFPAWGKHVRFRGNLYHGVLDSLSPTPTEVARGGTRTSLIVTYWRLPYQHIKRFPRQRFVDLLESHARRANGVIRRDGLENAMAALQRLPAEIMDAWRRPAAKIAVETIRGEPAFAPAGSYSSSSNTTAASTTTRPSPSSPASVQVQQPRTVTTHRAADVVASDALLGSSFTLRAPFDATPGSTLLFPQQRLDRPPAPPHSPPQGGSDGGAHCSESRQQGAAPLPPTPPTPSTSPIPPIPPTLLPPTSALVSVHPFQFSSSVRRLDRDGLLFWIPSFLSADEVAHFRRLAAPRFDADARASHTALGRAYQSADLYRPWEARADELTRRVEARIGVLTGIESHEAEAPLSIHRTLPWVPSREDTLPEGTPREGTPMLQNLHHDVGHRPRRIATVLVYLSDATDGLAGGETVFPCLHPADAKDIAGGSGVTRTRTHASASSDGDGGELCPRLRDGFTRGHRFLSEPGGLHADIPSFDANAARAAADHCRSGDEEGSQNRRGVRVEPLRGAALLFFPRAPSDGRDLPEGMWHGSCRVRKGEKYTLQQFKEPPVEPGAP